MNGESLTLGGLRVTDPLSTLTDSFCDALSIPRAHANTRLNILVEERAIDMRRKSQSLAEVGIGPETPVNIVVNEESKIFEWTIKKDNDRTSQSEHPRLLLANSCFLVHSKSEPDLDSITYHSGAASTCLFSDRQLQFDILCGSYELANGIVTCSWDVHVRRNIAFREERKTDGRVVQGVRPCRAAEGLEVETDSGWETMDGRASLKWRRVLVPDEFDANWLETKIASMSEEDLKKAVLEDVRANGLEEAEVTECLESDIEDLDELLRDCLPKLYKGQGLVVGYHTPLNICGALIPGKIMGPSASWIRLHESDEKRIVEESCAFCVPGMDFSRSRLLGIELCDLSTPVAGGQPLDLSDLPKLLGL